ncbi:leucine-rich repeat and calponin homology domain-containing protein 2-like isoform X1 [Lingula anatina]|uniref:Leucine-rich repeat and calponin homology domain-containing protein 2-like isoform X1 n=1 Tax=Lingula anatina TaxID=7574 RepID=A0A1S3IEY8_LINAN|nr:leucine-rich repeat and calponin homology domain-containing protein 2-like isoform X1 [Lingula anatina]|eukprot:XP_013396830.1 leucine-rich repeat and calponin homology domain-containing protein 2-like isoform X1 [Lingula anatina]
MSCNIFYQITNGLDEASSLAVRVASMKEQRSEKVREYQRRWSPDVNNPSPVGKAVAPTLQQVTSQGEDFVPQPVLSNMNLEDEFTRELNRQRADYAAKKRDAERIRREQEEEEEREERRRAALRLQEEQKVLLDRQREEARRKAEPSYAAAVVVNTVNYEGKEESSSPLNHRLPMESPVTPDVASSTPPAGYLVEDKQRFHNNNNNYRGHEVVNSSFQDVNSSQESQDYARNNGVTESPGSPTSPGPSYTYQPPVINHSGTAKEEFHKRREALLQQQRHEAQMVRRRMEEEKQRIKKIQKEAVHNFVYRRTSTGSKSADESLDVSTCSQDGTASTPTTSITPTTNNSSSLSGAGNFNLYPRSAYSPGASHTHHNEEEGDIYSSLNPNFTVRRHMERVREEIQQMDNLRKNIECRLKVTLPDDLSGALKDGVVLCHLANHVRPRSVLSIHVPSPAVPKLSLAKCRRNVENFLEACRKIGVSQDVVCTPDDILDEIRPRRVVKTVQQLLDLPRITLKDKIISWMCLVVFLGTCLLLGFHPWFI